MMELEQTWSFEDALSAHAVLDLLEGAEEEAHARAQNQAPRSKRTPSDKRGR